ncbi:phosphoribosyltransferase-like protein [Mesorhizobium abyssinicae]|uniref:phosphoribosyltransferase-like protein n=1 Tax=Mesorhizobium abyssinicae TaxID=1209958 RepID=UPI0033939736
MREEIFDALIKKIKQLTETAWYGKVLEPDVRQWLEQFEASDDVRSDEQLQALFLLSNFVYFGQREVRELLRSLYRDLFKTPAIHSIRRANGDTKDTELLNRQFAEHLSKTRFLGVGNPSESGVHLLYYFRQENRLHSNQFINTHEIFARDPASGTATIRIRNSAITDYVFIDDLCGSGTQAAQYSQDIIDPLRALNPALKVHYLVLFATQRGLDSIRSLHRYNTIAAVYELDDSFKALEPDSRIFNAINVDFDRVKVKATCMKYGTRLWARHPLGYKDSQLLIGFNHNTPDNTLPIFWADAPWRPIFKRYHKNAS